MALYFVNYYLRKSRDYQRLYDALNALGAVRILESLWAFKHADTSCVLIRDYLSKHIDTDDGLVVSQVADWASLRTKGVIPNT